MHKDDIEQARRHWRLRGQARPAGAATPGPGQESVWDYPRPPVIVADPRLVQVRLDGAPIAETRRSLRVLETASPPTYYLPPEAVQAGFLRPEAGGTFCEWKGRAVYFTVCVGARCVPHAAWSYPEPLAEFEPIRDYLAFYPAALECFVAGERVRAQAGGYYGGWITAGILGPFKGGPGSAGW